MSLRALLRLVRIPNVFTALSNVLAGVCLARAGLPAARDFLLVAASGALYLAGMVWNDYFDREVDARERPERPIPSGQISPRTAALLGSALGALGLTLCAGHGKPALGVGLTLTLCILAYDAGLKQTAAGPLVMGACRTLNVVLGLSALPWPHAVAWLLPLLLGLFTLLITRLSRFEVSGTQPQQLRSTVLGFGVLGGLLALALALQSALAAAGGLTLIVTAACYGLVLARGRALFAPLLREVSPPSLGRAIGGGILLMPALDAAFVAAAGLPLMAAGLLALAGPAYWLKRAYYVT